MKKFGVAAALVGAAAFTSASTAEAEDAKPAYTSIYEYKFIPDPLSVTVAFWSNYRFRGISQTKNAPGYNGSLDFEMELFKDVSIFAGVWASNVKFTDAHVEVDVYGGLKGKLMDGNLSWGVQFIGYLYPGAHPSLKYNYFEVMPTIGYDFGFASVTGGVALSPNFSSNSGFAAWPFVDISVPIPIEALKPYDVAFFAHAGYQTIEHNDRFGVRDYWEWEAGISAKIFGFKTSVKYGDTNLSRAQCFGGTKLCRAAVVFVISKTF